MDFIFFHTDNDGKAAAAILTRKFPNAILRPYNYFYSSERSFGDVFKNARLIFADITPTTNNLKWLMNTTNDIMIFDHHSSSLRDLEREGLTFPGKMTEDGLGACALVWEYFLKDKPIPLGIRYIAEYDAWERTPENKMFNFGITRFYTIPTGNIWDKIIDEDIVIMSKILDMGRSFLSYLVPWYKRIVRSYSIPGHVEMKPCAISGHIENQIPRTLNHKYTAVLLNQAAVDSSVFDDLEEKYDVYMRAVYGKDCVWLVSITTDRDDIDVAEIAKQFGGGGHRKSAGFAVDDIHEIFIPNGIEKPEEAPKTEVADTLPA